LIGQWCLAMLSQPMSLLPAFDIPRFSAEVKAGKLFLGVLMPAVEDYGVLLLLTRTVVHHHPEKRRARAYA
jgi:hypothetical protein